ncbi:DUF1015 domain-containing protein [Candidatus Sumerlaeota bacterium]|nr:DUF1015 domain-containing protein [Candidatus Sumerlaeota bacterium]
MPFHGYLPQPSLADAIASVPYDTVTVDEARSLAAGNELSFLHVVKPEIDFPNDSSVTPELISRRASDNLKRLIGSGMLVQRLKPCFFIYQQVMGEHVQYGLAAGASTAEYRDGKIKRHELTLRAKEDMIMRHMSAMCSDAGPVLLIYPQSDAIDALVKEQIAHDPELDFTSKDKVRHTVWQIDDAGAVRRLMELFEAIPALYIADGHHRASAASRIAEKRIAESTTHVGDEDYNFFLAVMIPDNQLRILDYNRAVKDLNGLAPDEFLGKLEEHFTIAVLGAKDCEAARPRGKGEFALLLDGVWRRLTIKPERVPDHPVDSLDCALLQKLVLSPILGIENPREDPRVDFIGGIRGLKELVRRCEKDCRAAFALYPTTPQQLFQVADAGELMPPKSTWFEPKQRSGLIVRTFH